MLLQRANRFLCASVDTQQRPQPSKPVGSRSPKTPAPETQTCDQHHNAAHEKAIRSAVSLDKPTRFLAAARRRHSRLRRPSYNSPASPASGDHARDQNPVQHSDNTSANEHSSEEIRSSNSICWPDCGVTKDLHVLRARSRARKSPLHAKLRWTTLDRKRSRPSRDSDKSRRSHVMRSTKGLGQS
jgi:hypothetical protein